MDLKKITANLSYLTLFLGGVAMFSGLVVFLTQANLSSQSQDIRSQASSQNLVEIKPMVASSNPTSTTKEIAFFISNYGQTINGVQLVFDIISQKNQFEGELLFKDSQQTMFVAHKETKSINKGKKAGIILLPKQPGQEVIPHPGEPLFILTIKSKKPDKLILNFDPNLSLVTSSQKPSQNLLKPLAPLTIDISDNPNSPNQPSFQLSGITKSVTIPATIFLKEETENSKPAIKLEILFQAYLVEQNTYLFVPQTPINWSTLNLDQQKIYQVLVKTPTSLRKKLGQLEFINQGFKYIQIENGKLVQGDFITQPKRENNLFNLKDISHMLAFYNKLSQPANTQDLKKLDVNYDGVFDIMDVAIVLANYNQLELKGN